MDAKKQRAVLAASVAGLLAAAGAVSFGQSAHAREGEKGGDQAGAVHCYGVNKCQGTGNCGGKGHSCRGQNACQGQGYLDLSQNDCLRITGGRLTEEAYTEPPT